MSDNVHHPHPGVFRPVVEPEVMQDSESAEQDKEQKNLKAKVKGSSSKRDAKGFGRRHAVAGDYMPFSLRPKNEWTVPEGTIRNNVQRPWLAHLDESVNSSQDVYHCLTEEILAFENYMESTAMEKTAMEKALSDFRSIIALTDPAMKVSVIGSRATGLAMPLSDIDINIEPTPFLHQRSGQRRPWPANYPMGRGQAINLLRTVNRKIRKKAGKHPMFAKSTLIEAKVPIINALHTATGLEIQLQCTTDSPTTMELVKAYITEFPTLRPLFLVLRQVLKMRGLGEAGGNGIGSYALIMMIVATLKFSSARFNRRDAGKQLLYFLDFYSKIEFKSIGISVDPPELFPKSTQASENSPEPFRAGDRGMLRPDEIPTTQARGRGMSTFDEIPTTEANNAAAAVSLGRKPICTRHPSRPYLMCLQDPANPYNDLGKLAFAIKHVQATFTTLSLKMRTSMNFCETRQKHDARFSLLDPCLMGDYRLFERKRNALRDIGGKLTVEPVVAKYL